jgi:hypothetical protein
VTLQPSGSLHPFSLLSLLNHRSLTGHYGQVGNTITYDNRSLDECSLIAAAHVAKLLDGCEVNNGKVLVISHAFSSNGGAHVVERLEIVIEQARNGTECITEIATTTCYLLGNVSKEKSWIRHPSITPHIPSSRPCGASFPVVFCVLCCTSWSRCIAIFVCYLLDKVFGVPNGRNEFFR